MKAAFVWLITFYQRRISPAFPPRCKYYPTCSEYAKQAVDVHGAFKGLLLAVWRVLRCNPLAVGGYDAVPVRGRWRGKKEEN